jgi:hypothetical protein
VGNPLNVTLGPGLLYIAALSSTEPTDLATGWPGAWTLLGYTEDGSKFTYTLTVGDVMVAEEFDPIKKVTTARQGLVEFSLAEMTATNLKRALNGGTIVSGGAFVTFTPPVPGAEVRTMLGFQSQDGLERWVWRQCLQGGAVALERRKAPNKTKIPMAFGLEKPSGLDPFKAIFDNTRQ